jgi:hypothetical protein
MNTFMNLNRKLIFLAGFLFLSLSLFGFVAPVEAQTISSEANQSFTVGDTATDISTITITDDVVKRTIKANKDIRIRIPSTFNMTWDTSITTVTIGGGASGKVNTTLKNYEDGNKTLVIDVANDFPPMTRLLPLWLVQRLISPRRLIRYSTLIKQPRPSAPLQCAMPPVQRSP